MCYYSNSVTVSSAKVENVVKPPHIPALRNSTAHPSSPVCFAAALMSPMANAPTTFMMSVFTGNTLRSLSGSSDIPYRADKAARADDQKIQHIKSP